MDLYRLFKRCLNVSYNHVENSGDYAIERIGNTLYIYLEGSDGIKDWWNNFDFPARPYKRMGRTVWYAHRGFLKVWKSIEKHVAMYIADKSVDSVITVGFSHGAALAVLCHEYIWYNRPDIRNSIYGYGFASPRVIWGIPNGSIKCRWQNFTVIRNIDDIVTHVPPLLLGYHHVGAMKKIGESGRYSRIDAHRPENILYELEKLYK